MDGAAAAPKCSACAAGSMREITRPFFQLQSICPSERPATARTASSNSSERSAFIAFGPRATPAPISLSSGAAS